MQSDAAKPPPEQSCRELRERGYTILPQLIDSDLMDAVRNELAPYLQRKHMGRNDFEGTQSERVYALLAKSPSMAKLIEHPQVLALLDQLLPKGYWLSAALAINVHPGETPQPFHRDDGNNALPMPRPWYGISTIWALDDFSADNGATEVIPGSHLWEEHQQASEATAVKVIMPKGSVVLFAGNLIHRGGANDTASSRLGITPQYTVPWLRQIENMVLAVPPAIAANYSERIQQLLGYSVIDPGFMGYVDGMHPKRLINASYKGRKYRSELPSP